MTIVSVPNERYYVGLSTDVVDGKLPKVEQGGKVFLSDLGTWKVVNSDLSLSDYVDGLPRESNGGIPVNLQDQHSPIVGLYMGQPLEDITLASDGAIGDRTITLTSGHSTAVGNYICLKENSRFFQGMVLNVATDVITLDSPLDYAFTTGASCHRMSIDMTVNGSVTPQEFQISPPAGTSWDVTKVVFHIEDSTTMDDGTFGGINALTNGIVLQSRNGIYKNEFNIKRNGDFSLFATKQYVDKPPSGTGYAINATRTFAGQNETGVTIRLTEGDTLVLIVQDDLTGLDVFNIVVHGHVVENN